MSQLLSFSSVALSSLDYPKTLSRLLTNDSMLNEVMGVLLMKRPPWFSSDCGGKLCQSHSVW